MDFKCIESADYAEVLHTSIDRLEDVSAAYRAREWTQANEITKEIVAAYAPNDPIAAIMISTLLEFTFRRAWFDGMKEQADRIYK